MNYIDSIRLKGTEQITSYVKNLPITKNLARKSPLDLNKSVTFFVGENGTGKSTLLEAIAINCGFNPEGGTRNFSFSTMETHSDLNNYLTVSKRRQPKDGFFMRAESFYNVASNIEKLDSSPGGGSRIIDSYGGISLHNQSHGESFMALVLNRFGGNGLYILDEPEAALSPSKQMSLLICIKQLVENNSQFIIATHSPILMSFPNAQIYELTEDDIRLTKYTETEHYQITKEFLDNPERMLKYLFEE
ncbi:AAA family ATPase [Haloimpatiens sp. FM7330]|uniref:AAA family ATPase n=1 Tax=Haloimpatiens sp. FM7330 TaxID=3298610 RepID=UPI00362CF140